jgi:uncharacterized integral membrane protein
MVLMLFCVVLTHVHTTIHSNCTVDSHTMAAATTTAIIIIIIIVIIIIIIICTAAATTTLRSFHPSQHSFS